MINIDPQMIDNAKTALAAVGGLTTVATGITALVAKTKNKVDDKIWDKVKKAIQIFSMFKKH